METKREKVYVAIGPELLDGFSTLQWTFRRWSCHEISCIVILYAADNMSRDYVYTPLGKLPVSSVSEEKLKALEKFEDAEKDKILSQYINFCCKVKVEYRKMEKTDQPLHSRIVEIISTLKITRLVMSLAFMKTSSGKSRPAISGSCYVVRQKPDFCQLFVISGGRLVFLREDKDEGIVEDDKGFMVARFKERNRSIRNWLGKMFVENAGYSSPDSPSSSRSNSLSNQWERYSEEIEQYVNRMLSLHAQEEGQISVENNCSELNIPENKDAHERIRILKRRIQDAQDAVQLNRNEANAAGDRSEMAQWIITIGNNRAEELEACINGEVMKHVDLKQQLGQRRHELHELEIEVKKSRSKLDSITQLQKEVTDKLQLSTCAKSQTEIQLENAVKTQADMVQEIEKLRNQRDVLQRRTEFCHEKYAIETESKLTELGFEFREFSAAQVRAATDNFSPRHRLKSGGNWTNVYRGRISHMTVAIKMHDPFNAQCHEAFAAKVKFVSQVRHPNLLPVIGFCSEINCIIYEYMHNGSLQDALLSTESSMRTRQSLSWHNRMRIAAEICSALGFLHKAKPKPITHANLSLLKILLDCNNVAKLNGLKSPWLSDDESYDVKSDICTFGNFLVQLLTGKNWDLDMDSDTIMGRLDQLAGKWPLDLAMELCSIALRCLSCKKEEEPVNEMPVKDINDLKEKADELILNTTSVNCFEINVQDFNCVPGAFICPIYQEVMLDPHVAADGFSYELEAISAWLRTGRDTSPMTNLRLSHKFLTPNHTLRSLIQDWQNKSSGALPN